MLIFAFVLGIDRRRLRDGPLARRQGNLRLASRLLRTIEEAAAAAWEATPTTPSWGGSAGMNGRGFPHERGRFGTAQGAAKRGA